jgi:hypothetical protein
MDDYLSEQPNEVPLEPREAATRKVAAPLGAILDALVELIRDYMVVTAPQASVVALWIAHTHAVEAFETTAFLAITSPEKQWGKTRLLDVLELVVARPWRAIMPSEAVVYRKIADVQPTLMLDETDAVFDESNPGSCNPCMCGKCEGRRVRHLRSNRFRGVTSATRVSAR